MMFLLLGSTARAQCSHRGSAWGPFQNPAGQPCSLERNPEDADKKPKNQKEPWFWLHLLSHTAPSSVCCFSPVPQAIQGLTLVLVQLSRKQKKTHYCSYCFWNMMCMPWRGEEINNSGTRKIKTSKWSQNPKSWQNTSIGYFLFLLPCDFFFFFFSHQ